MDKKCVKGKGEGEIGRDEQRDKMRRMNSSIIRGGYCMYRRLMGAEGGEGGALMVMEVFAVNGRLAAESWCWEVSRWREDGAGRFSDRWKRWLVEDYAMAGRFVVAGYGMDVKFVVENFAVDGMLVVQCIQLIVVEGLVGGEGFAVGDWR